MKFDARVKLWKLMPPWSTNEGLKLPLTHPWDIGKPISLTPWGNSPVADELSHRSKPNLPVLASRTCGVEWQWLIVSSCNEAPHSWLRCLSVARLVSPEWWLSICQLAPNGLDVGWVWVPSAAHWSRDLKDDCDHLSAKKTSEQAKTPWFV